MKFILIIVISLHSILFSGLLPDYDKNCDYMNCSPPIVLPSEGTIYNFLDKDVPKIIHQIWFGKASKCPKAVKEWEKYQLNGWKYHLWTEKDMEAIQAFAYRDSVELIRECLKDENWWAASDILRYELMRAIGGIYVDCDFKAPHDRGKKLPIEHLFRMKGITFVTEHHGRRIGADSAIFVMNGILVAPQGHPLFEHVCASLPKNVRTWKKYNNNINAMYATGPFLLNRCISGPIQLLPIQYIHPFMID